LFPGSDPEFINLLEKMLQANPSKRITANEALDNPIFDDFRQEINEQPCVSPLSADFESLCEATENLAPNVLREVMWYREVANKGIDSSVLRRQKSDGYFNVVDTLSSNDATNCK
jgi:serine/threonine protein kinase